MITLNGKQYDPTRGVTKDVLIDRFRRMQDDVIRAVLGPDFDPAKQVRRIDYPDGDRLFQVRRDGPQTDDDDVYPSPLEALRVYLNDKGELPKAELLARVQLPETRLFIEQLFAGDHPIGPGEALVPIASKGLQLTRLDTPEYDKKDGVAETVKPVRAEDDIDRWADYGSDGKITYGELIRSGPDGKQSLAAAPAAFAVFDLIADVADRKGK